MYYVYRYMRGNKWIYVGKADASKTPNELMLRIHDHARDHRFKLYDNLKISYCALSTRSDMNAVEAMLIKLKHPVINVTDRTLDILPFIYDSSKISWVPIEQYNEQNNKRKQTVPELLDNNVRSFIIRYFNNSRPEYCNKDYLIELAQTNLAKRLLQVLVDYAETNNTFNYTNCISEFCVDYGTLLHELSYPKQIKPATLNRILRESIGRVFDSDPRSADWWSIKVKRDGEQYHFRVLHMDIMFRDYYNEIERSITASAPNEIIERGA